MSLNDSTECIIDWMWMRMMKRVAADLELEPV
jgi:hypothetical protein